MTRTPSFVLLFQAALLVGLGGARGWAQAVPPSVPSGAYVPRPAPEQPIAFSHRTHLSGLGLECTECHATALTETAATIPDVASCVSCHAPGKPASAEVQKIAAYAGRKEEIPWKRVYRVPPYVYFSHAVHLGTTRTITCSTCHGDVASMDATQKVADTSMAACTECHKQHAAPILCDSCHEKL